MSKNPSIVVQTSRKLKTVFLPSALALFLSACVDTSSFFKNEITESLKNEAYATSEFYVNKANQATKLEDQQSYRLLAIRKLLDENKLQEAQFMFEELSPNLAELQKNLIQKTEYDLLSAQLAVAKKQVSRAEGLLKQVNLAQLSQAQQARFYQTQAKLAELKKDVIEAVRARSMMDNFLTDTRARQENNDQIWALLRNANRGMLAGTQPRAGEVALAGWLALISTYNNHLSNPAQIPQAIQTWKGQYPNHSAAILLPTELQNASSFQQTNVNSMALLLPLSGDGKILSDIIKQGFNDAKGDDSTAIQFFDTDSAPVPSLLAQAKQQGAQAIVGPLFKPRIDEMLASPEVNNINILALNSTPNVRAIAQVCYYGLSPEAEAKAGAERIFQENRNHVIVIAPNGDFGQRSSEAFANRWRQLTNNDAEVRFYNEAFEVVTHLQNGGAKQGTAVYLLGNANQVLEAKQTLDNSELAGQLAIYSSSRSHSPNSGIDFFTTMEGVKFSEIPLLADKDSETYQKAESNAQGDYSMMRLYAMGSDAWALARNFNEFRQIPGYKVSGLTGILTAGTNCNIERTMTWLEYRGGSVQVAP
ncbi:penicillin-binding protein [Pasteurellaceae bacterium RH1A]|nr:penicillin-binding protein [Pasteurellaceae bacterium RH1A]